LTRSRITDISKIGRASCGKSVDLGGRRIIKKKRNLFTSAGVFTGNAYVSNYIPCVMLVLNRGIYIVPKHLTPNLYYLRKYWMKLVIMIKSFKKCLFYSYYLNGKQTGKKRGWGCNVCVVSLRA